MYVHTYITECKDAGERKVRLNIQMRQRMGAVCPVNALLQIVRVGPTTVHCHSVLHVHTHTLLFLLVFHKQPWSDNR